MSNSHLSFNFVRGDLYGDMALKYQNQLPFLYPKTRKMETDHSKSIQPYLQLKNEELANLQKRWQSEGRNSGEIELQVVHLVQDWCHYHLYTEKIEGISWCYCSTF